MIKVLCLDHPAYQSFWPGGTLAGAGWQAAPRVRMRGDCELELVPFMGRAGRVRLLSPVRAGRRAS